ncbi:MAG: hypothetical protein ACI81L_002300 [Verrucomicrobiales bacterium]|jgi:hypothetical protein
MFTTEMYEEPGSRFTDRVEFVVGIFGDEEAVPSTRALIDGSPFSLSSFETSEGRGAEGLAVGAALNLLMDGGAIYGGGQAAYMAWRWLREKFGEKVMLSHGAARKLIEFDILRKNPELTESDLVLIFFAETSDSVSELNHTGLDMFSAVLCTRTNTQSWSYLVSSMGKVLHDGAAGPLPKSNLYSVEGVEVDWDLEDPESRELGDD